MNIFKTCVIIALITFIAGCSGSKSGVQTKEKEPKIVDRGYGIAYDSEVAQSSKTSTPNEKAPSNRSLTEMIMALPGVTMTSQGPRIGGVGSFGNTEPLFVINGTASGASYSQIVSMINPNDIISVTALKGSEAAIYGSRAGNGVILIRTK